MIPAKHTCAGDHSPGQDVSPPFTRGARSGALTTATVPDSTSTSAMAQIETAIKNASSANTVLHGRSNATA